jgi:hypothetical protein
MHWIDLLGYAASASVLLTFCMSTMLPLRRRRDQQQRTFRNLRSDSTDLPSTFTASHPITCKRDPSDPDSAPY